MYSLELSLSYKRLQQVNSLIYALATFTSGTEDTYCVIKCYKLLTFLTNFGVSISMNPERTASRKLFWLLNVMRPEPGMTNI